MGIKKFGDRRSKPENVQGYVEKPGVNVPRVESELERRENEAKDPQE